MMEEVWKFICLLKLCPMVVFVVFMSMKWGQCSTLNGEGVDREQLTGVTTRESCIGRFNFWHIGKHGDIAYRRELLKAGNAAKTQKTNKAGTSPSLLSPDSEPFSPTESPSNPPSQLISPEISPSPSIFTPSPLAAPTPSYISLSANPPSVQYTPTHSNWISIPSPSPSSNQGVGDSHTSDPKRHSERIWYSVGGFSFLILVSAIGCVCCKGSKVGTVKPWATGLSGQLQKAFVKGVPSLKLAEVEAACEDFSNIIGSMPYGTIYKGTLSSGVEIAVASSAVTSPQNWSKNMEAQFRKKIETLSRVNHKNFVNLIGYCEEYKPFTRMMLFEYAPNGTLFEHLHIREAERLDWGMRMRIAMGIAYCLEHLHQLTPAISLKNLVSSYIYLTEDYAAKLSDLSFWNDIDSTEKNFEVTTQLLETTSSHIKENVYSFGVILFELITGRIPYAVDNGFSTDWAAEYIKGQPLRDLVDRSLKLEADSVEKWSQVINNCVHPDPEKRPSMKEVTTLLKEITAMNPDGATPKSSPLWWAELEIMSESD